RKTIWPPSPSQPAASVPASLFQCQTPPSVPLTKTSARLDPHDTAVGGSPSWPPRLACQPPALVVQCQSAWSAPSTYTSPKPLLLATEAGPWTRPPREDQPGWPAHCQ